MPSYLIIETTNNRPVNSGGSIIPAANEAEAVAILLGGNYAYEQTFEVFDISTSKSIKTEQSRSVDILDASDPTGITVLGSYDEEALADLQAAHDNQ
jgi:hypothetical protein